MLHDDCLARNPGKTVFDNTILLGATRESMGLHGVGGQAQPQLIYAYAWWLWTSPFGIFKMINASNSMRIERLADVFHLPQLTTSIRTIISEEYDMSRPGNDILWRGEVSPAGANWLNDILNHPLWVENIENRCSNKFHTFMIHQSNFTSLTDDIDVAKQFAEIRPAVAGNTNNLFQIMGEVRITDGGNIEYIDNIVKTNHSGYQDISFWPGEREYLLKPGIFFIRCPSNNPVENIPQSAEESEHKIIKVYHYPLGEVYELSLAIMLEFIDEYAIQARLREGDIGEFKIRVRSYFRREREALKIVFKNFIDPSNNQRVGVTRNWIESLINSREIRANFEQEYILPIFGEVENVDYSGYYAIATLLFMAGISVITNLN